MIAPRELRFAEDGAYGRALEHASTPSRVLDDLEPLPDDGRELREARSRFVYVLNCALSWILDARSPKVAAAQVAVALGGAVFDGRPMEQIGAQFGVGRAAISKGSRAFARSAGIEPVGALKRDTTSYRAARVRSIQKNQHKETQK